MIYLSFFKEATEDIIPKMGEYEILYQFSAKNDSDNKQHKDPWVLFLNSENLAGGQVVPCRRRRTLICA